SVLTLAGAGAGTSFGNALALDGNTLLVGMRRVARADSARGGVQVFTRGSDGTWADAGALGGTPEARSSFGSALALSGDWAYVGAPGTRPGGVVHVFRRSGGTWTPAGSITVESGLGDRFGSAIAVDGDRVAIGAPGRDGQRGMVYLFRRGADGSFSLEGSVAGRRALTNSQLGNSLLLSGDQLWAGGPNAASFTGMVVGFERNSSGAWVEGSTLVPFESASARFGASLLQVGDELWIGAPLADGRHGRIYRARFEDGGNLVSMTKLGSDSSASGSGFGNQMAMSGGTVLVGMPNDAGNLGSAQFVERGTDGSWQARALVFPAAGAALQAMTGSETNCSGEGKAGQFGCSNTSLYSFLPISQLGGRRGTNLNDNWGWTDPQTGREYAIVGRTDGTSFVDVTDPANPRYL